MSSIIAIANQKGGVGKTTTAINLATALAAVGKKILLLDLDPQGNATTGLGVKEFSDGRSAYEVVCHQEKIELCIVNTSIPGLFIIPSSLNLAGFEIEYAREENRPFLLKTALTSLQDYDYILIDCPPALGLLTLNALCATHRILVPLQCEFYALHGLSQLFKTIQRIQTQLNPALEFFGIVLTMYEKRSSLSDLVEEDVRSYFGDLVFKTVIPRNVRISESPSHGKPVLIYDVRSSGSLAYMKLAVEILKRDRESQWKQKDLKAAR